MMYHGWQNQHKNILVVILLSLAFGVMSSASVAIAKEKRSKSQSKKTQSINFEDELIEGAGKKPDLFWLQSKKKFNFRKLIKLRENFLPEMERTAEDLKRAGSAD